jgi:transcriptional regulator with PAS, ATPase and Fis domain
MSNQEEIGADDILLGTEDPLPETISQELTMREYNMRILSTYLKKHNDNIPLVAEKLDISQSTIYRMLKSDRVKDGLDGELSN